MQQIISSLEKWLRMDIRYLASGGFFLSLTNVIGAVVSLILTIAFANLISQETYGVYRYILSGYALLALFALPGMDTALIRAVSSGERGAYMHATYIKMCWGTLGTVAAGIIAWWYGTHDNNTLAILFLLAGVSVPLIESMGLYNSFLYGMRFFRLSSMLEIAVQIFGTCALLVTLFFSNDILLIITIYFISTGAARAIAFFYTLPLDNGQKNFTDKDLYHYGKHITFYEIVGRGSMAVDALVLWHVLGPVAVALFTLATAVPIRIQSLLKISGTLALPKFTNRPAAEVTRTLVRKMLFFGVGILILSSIYALLAKPFFTLFFPAYIPSVPYSQVLVFYTLSAITYPFWSYLMANKRLKEIYLITGVNLFVKIIVLVIGVPLIGIWGAVASYLTSGAINIFLVLFLMIRISR